MPIHDWTRVGTNRFYHFHQTWTANLAAALNSGCLPPGFFALAEQITGGPEADVVALELTPPPGNPSLPATYASGSEIVAYIEPVAVGDILPDRPIFLMPDYYVNCPLEATYEATWRVWRRRNRVTHKSDWPRHCCGPYRKPGAACRR